MLDLVASGSAIIIIATVIAVIAASILAYASYLTLEAQISGTACEDSGLLELYGAIQALSIIVGAIFGGAAGGALGSMLISLLSNAIPSSATEYTCPNL